MAESLGENKPYLHGLPCAVAPDLQKQAPMVTWFSAGALASLGLDTAGLQTRAQKPAAHQHLFHTLLAWLDVKTAL